MDRALYSARTNSWQLASNIVLAVTISVTNSEEGERLRHGILHLHVYTTTAYRYLKLNHTN